MLSIYHGVILNAILNKHARESIQYLRDAYKYGLESGDMIYCGHSINSMCMCRIMTGDNLDDIYTEHKKYENFQLGVKDPFVASDYCIHTQMYLNLKGLIAKRGTLNSGGYNEERELQKHREKNNLHSAFYHLLVRIRIHYIAGNYSECIRIAQEMENIVKVTIGNMYAPEYFFYYSLALTAEYKSVSAGRKLKYRIQLARNQKKMRTWAKFCPENFLHKYLLVNAEIARCRGKHKIASSLYDQAIKSARENQYTQNEAIATELAALHMKEMDNINNAHEYMQEARYCYIKWGATAKVKDLEEKYPDLIPDGLRKTGDDSITDTDGSSRTTGSQTLDLNTVIRTSQLLSSEMDLGRLLSTIMQLSIENAGAQKGFFILDTDGELTITAVKEEGKEDSLSMMQSMPLEVCDELSKPIVNYVHRSGEDVILRNAFQEGPFTNDPHIIRNKCKSLLCTPIKRKGRLSGILYMENNLTSGAFTPERLELLHVISAQAAISLENATLYLERMRAQKEIEKYSNNLEVMVNERTLELEKALNHLKETQSKLLQSEKMASIGQLAAGVAHEINNPMGFISSNLGTLDKYVAKLTEYIALQSDLVVRCEDKAALAALEEQRNANKIDYISADIKDLIKESLDGAERVKKIVQDLKSFSCVDQAEHKHADINECLETTINIAWNELKYKAVVKKEYGDIPSTRCYPQQLNQAFLSLLVNAAHAIEVQGEIGVRTWVENDSIFVLISDTGCGIKPANLNRIFEPFYTTKDVGKGTGLGLSITYDIIKKHGGEITVTSEIGKGSCFTIRLPVTA